MLYLFAQLSEVTKEISSWERLMDKYGLPTVYLFVICCAIFYTARWIRDKVATPLIESHKSLCQNLAENNSRNTENLERMADGVKQIADKQDGMFKVIQTSGEQFVNAIEKQTEEIGKKMDVQPRKRMKDEPSQ